MKILILMYHMISDTDHLQEKRYAVSPRSFGRQMGYLKYSRYTPVSLVALHRYIVDQVNNTLPEKPIVITFDDGYMDNYENALPILREFDFPATAFIVSGLVGKTNSWMTAEGYPEKHLMGWREIEEMKKNRITIGSHTINHRRLSTLNSNGAKNEIEGSKKFLEDKLGIPINHFAYPYGDMNQSIVSMVEEAGYNTACSTKSGFNSEGTNPFALRRIEVYGTDTLWNFIWKLKFGTNEATWTLPLTYYFSRILDRLPLFAPRQ